MKKPSISIIVPVFNQEKYIGRCLRSLLNQTMPNDDYEIIVVDDASYDRTPYALELFHSGIRTIRNITNLGLPSSLNIGIKASRAPFIIRVDSDDYVNINFLHFLYIFLDMNPGFDAVSCDYWLFDDSENWLDRVNSDKNPIGCGIMFRRERLFEVGLYDENFRIHEEQDLRIRFEQKYTISRLALPLYRYRRHQGNLTNDKKAVDYHYRNLYKKHNIKNK
jgi:glycosyltransferase involved in cell wall biosynthesis